MATEIGRSPADAGSGHSAQPEPSFTVSAVPASVPNAGDGSFFAWLEVEHLSLVATVGDAIFDSLCPGIRFTPEDDARYEAAARAALRAANRWWQESYAEDVYAASMNAEQVKA
jgi:hypothetical protein